MTTAYIISDTLPKDSGGINFAALIHPETLDFVLSRAVSVSAVSGKNLGHAGVATHIVGEALDTADPIIAIGGVTGSPSASASFGEAQMVSVDRTGALKTSLRQYTWLASGSTAASADTNHSIFGSYGGLSSVASWVTVHISIHPSANNFWLYPTVNTIGRGQRMVAGNDYYQDLPPMSRHHASQLHFLNETNGSNSHLNWSIWY